MFLQEAFCLGFQLFLAHTFGYAASFCILHLSIFSFIKARYRVESGSGGERTGRKKQNQTKQRLRAGWRPKDSSRVRACLSNKGPSGIPCLSSCCFLAFSVLESRRETAGSVTKKITETLHKGAATKPTHPGSLDFPGPFAEGGACALQPIPASARRPSPAH